MKKLLASFVLLLSVFVASFAQPTSPDQLREQLKQRGVSEEALNARLKQKGIDITNVDPANASQVQAAVWQTVLELEAEKGPAPAQQANPAGSGGSAAEQTTPVQVVKPSETPAAPNISDNDLYGQHLFKGRNLVVYQRTDDILPSDNYILGSGDKLTVNIWGNAAYSGTYEIDREGYINPERVGRISLKGMSYGTAKEMLRSRFGRVVPFTAGNFSANVTTVRNITVNVVGEAANVGSFSMPASNTAFNLLVAAGGMTDIGSVRNIKLVRAGAAPKRLDLYELLVNPELAKEYFLLENDYVHIPVVGRTVKISGAINRPMRYELIAGENLVKLIEFAGGLTNNAFKKSVQVSRFVNDKETLIDVPLQELLTQRRDFELLPGDVVIIKKIPTTNDYFVTAEGEFVLPDRYEYKQGMRVKELLDKAVLKREARTDVAFVQRINADKSVAIKWISVDNILKNAASNDNFELMPEDKLVVYPQSRYSDDLAFSINGAVRSPGDFRFDSQKGLRLSDAIFLAGGLKPDAETFGYLVRANPLNPEETTYIRFDLAAAMANPKSSDNFVLQPIDKVQIMSKKAFFDEAKIYVKGEVRMPGDFNYGNGLSLKDVLTMAGGLQVSASRSRIDVFRLKIDGDNDVKTVTMTFQVDSSLNVSGASDGVQLQPFDQVIVRQAPEFELISMVTINGEVKYPGAYALTSKNEKISTLIQRSGGLGIESFAEGATLTRSQGGLGLVVIRLDEILASSGSKYDISLVEGDEINVPKRKELVTITGFTKALELYPDQMLKNGNRVNVPYEGRRALHYVRKYANGVSDVGDRKLITVEHPNGELRHTRSFLFVTVSPKVRPGSIVKVGHEPPKPAEQQPGATPKEDVNWGKTLAESIASATAILSLILLLQRVN